MPSFNGCTKLTEITLPDSISQVGDDGSDSAEPIFYATAITFLESPEGATYLGYGLLTGSSIESIVIPSTMEWIMPTALDSDALKAIYFRGTEEQFTAYTYEEIDTPIYFLSETQPTEEGNYWHYVDGKPVIW